MLPFGWWNSAPDDSARILQLLDSLLASMVISVTEVMIDPDTQTVPADSLDASMVSLLDASTLIQLNIAADLQDQLNLTEVGPFTRGLSDSLDALMVSGIVDAQALIALDINAQLQDDLTLLEVGPFTQSSTESLDASMTIVMEEIVEFVRNISASLQDNLTLDEQGPLDQDSADSLSTSMDIVVEPSEVIELNIAANLQDSLSLSEVLATPAAPTNLNVIDGTTPGDADLSWTDNADNEDNYMVERREYPGPTSYNIITSSLPANTTAYTDTGTVCDVEYDWRVRATNSRGNSPPSNTENLTLCVEA